MLELQNNKCVICGRELHKIYVDHDHETGRVRGLLCQHCNSMLGFAKDNLIILEKAIKYLSKTVIL